MSPFAPKITVVTVVYNAADLLEPTLRSVTEQTYPNIEYVVIDGGSTDGTVELIRKYAEKINYWVSQPDRGIYDAMNKAVAVATGTYICFMNAGDWFASARTVEDAFAQVPPHADMVYGDHEVRFSTFSRYHRALPLSVLWRRNAFVHQSLFARTELLRAQPFDLRYRMAADFHFIYTQYRQGRVFFYTGTCICSFAAGGASEQNILQSYRETWQIVRKEDRRIVVDLFHATFIARHWLLLQLKKRLPTRTFERLMQLRTRFISLHS